MMFMNQTDKCECVNAECQIWECEYQCLFEAFSLSLRSKAEKIWEMCINAVIRIVQVEPELQLSAYKSE